LWRQYIETARESGQFTPADDILLLDGIPRNVRQAELLDSALDVQGIFYLSCPDPAKLVERLQRRALKENRLDDANLDTIRHRLDVYEGESRAVLDFYGPERLHRIDATQPPIAVLQDMLKVLVRT
jgi:adenylate kinase